MSNNRERITMDSNNPTSNGMVFAAMLCRAYL